MKKRYIALIAVAVVLVLVAVILAQATTIYSAQVIAGEEGSQIGIAPFTDRIDFGDIPVGVSITKDITLENHGSVDNNVKVFVMGSIGTFMEITPRSFTLEAGEVQNVELALAMPMSAEPGQKFTGRVIILRIPRSLW